MRINIIIEIENRNDSIVDIENKIKIFQENLIIFKKEFMFLTNESIEEQRNYQQEYQNILSQEAVENAEYEKDLAVKAQSLTNLTSHIANLTEEITNNKFRNKTLNEKIRMNQKQLKKVNSELKALEKKLKFFQEKSQSIDKKTFQEIKKSISTLPISMSIEERKCFEIELSLFEVAPIEANIQKQWDELWKNVNSKVVKEKEKIQIINTEILNWKNKF